MNRDFETICTKLRAATDKGYSLGIGTDWERQFRRIPLMIQAEEGCSLRDSKRVAASWWESATKVLTDKSIPHTCLAAFPLHALKVAYNRRKKRCSQS